MPARRRTVRLLVVLASMSFAVPASVRAQATRPTTQGAGSGAAAPVANAVKPEQYEQLVAPIALYPDALLSQVLMASTYPLEIVQADRWVKENPKLKDNAAELNKLTWDASVKSLLDFPQVLGMMSSKLDWTVKLGDAFIADQKATLDAVQRLRKKAYDEGNLKDSKEQKVTVQAAAPATEPAAPGAPPAAPAPQVIVVQSASPTTVYVPTYNPTVVYGGWPYPTYPPYSYYPPGYVAGTALLSFGIGVACGAAWGHAWGNCNWHGGDVDVDVNKNVNFNSNIDRDAAQKNIDKRQADRDIRQGDRQGDRDARQAGRQGKASSFQHDPSHRKGVSYRDSATTEKFRGAGASQSATQARESYRGRTEAGRADISCGAADSFRGTGGTPGGIGGTRTPGGAGGAGGTRTPGNTGVGGTRTPGGAGGGVGQTRAPSAATTGTRSSGFTNSGSSNTRAASDRGSVSRSSGGFSGGSRSGGVSRGGGGGRGGRR